MKDGSPYPWNPQSHILYHFVVDQGHAAWQGMFEPSPISTYRYLKLFTGLCGLAFLAGVRRLFVELGLTLGFRLPLLLLTGLSVSAWFHFAAFETHCLAMPALAAYLIAIARLTTRPLRRPIDRVVLVASLLVCGWTRLDLFRLTAMTGILLLVPALGRHRRSLALDLSVVFGLGILGNAVLASVYLDRPLAESVATPLERRERDELQDRLGDRANLSVGSLVTVGRAISLYSIVMPAERQPEGRGFLAPITHEMQFPRKRSGVLPSTDLFSKPARNLCASALGPLMLVGTALALSCALGLGLARALAGFPLHTLLIAQALAGWVFYTWFNPFEPFLWILEFLPIWIVLLATALRDRARATHVAALWTLALCVGVHNWFAFYLPFR